MNLLINKITSLQNEKVKFLIKLRKRSQRTKSNKTFVDGTREVLRIMNNTNLIQEFYINKELLSETLLSKLFNTFKIVKKALLDKRLCSFEVSTTHCSSPLSVVFTYRNITMSLFGFSEWFLLSPSVF